MSRQHKISPDRSNNYITASCSSVLSKLVYYFTTHTPSHKTTTLHRWYRSLMVQSIVPLHLELYAVVSPRYHRPAGSSGLMTPYIQSKVIWILQPSVPRSRRIIPSRSRKTLGSRAPLLTRPRWLADCSTVSTSHGVVNVLRSRDLGGNYGRWKCIR